MLKDDFFNKEPIDLAISLLGKVMRRKVIHPKLGALWLSARIIETEAYYVTEKGSHSSLGFTEKRKAMFMAPGTIYMYYARGGDSINFSAKGDGNGVLIKSGHAFSDRQSPTSTLAVMQKLNPGSQKPRSIDKLCSGQTLLCRSLDLKVPDWNQQKTVKNEFYLQDLAYQPKQIVRCRRLGIPAGRDEHLMLRFVDSTYARFCTSNPLTKRKWREGKDYELLGG